MHTLRLVIALLLFLAAPAFAQEYIVVSGGPALRKWEDYRVPAEQHDRYAGNFIKAAHIRLQQIRVEHPQAQLTWLVFRPAYSSRDREDAVRQPPFTCYTNEINERAGKVGARIVWFS